MNNTKSEDDERLLRFFISLSLSQTITHKHSLFLYPRRVMMTNGSNGVNSAFVYE